MILNTLANGVFNNDRRGQHEFLLVEIRDLGIGRTTCSAILVEKMVVESVVDRLYLIINVAV